MTPMQNASALLLFGGLSLWEGIGFVILILVCPAMMYFGIRGKRKQPDRDTKSKEKDTDR